MGVEALKSQARPGDSTPSQELHLQSLPNEIIENILEHSDRASLHNLCLVSSWSYARAVGHIWRDVTLSDQRSWRPIPPGHTAWKRRHLQFTVPDNDDSDADADVPGHIKEGRMLDDHDETPMLKKLFVLATNPYVAAKVQRLTHRCHLPSPELFQSLARVAHEGLVHSRHHLHDFQRSTLCRLVLQAVANMRNVNALVIIYGHWAIVETLLWGFFGPLRDKDRCRPVARLWLESCSLSSMRWVESWHLLDFSQVESVRLRRMRLQEWSDEGGYANHTKLILARGTDAALMRNHAAGHDQVSSIIISRNKALNTGDDLHRESQTAAYMTELTLREVVDDRRLSATFVSFLYGLVGPEGWSAPCMLLGPEELRIRFRHAQSLHSVNAILQLLECHGPLYSSARSAMALYSSPDECAAHVSDMYQHQFCTSERFKDLIGRIPGANNGEWDVQLGDRKERHFAYQPMWYDPPVDNLIPTWHALYGTFDGYTHDLNLSQRLRAGVMNATSAQRLYGFRRIWNQTLNPLLPRLFTSSTNLSSLTIDWIIWYRDARSLGLREAEILFHRLAGLHFPRLRAFQLRNTISSDTRLPEGIYLFSDSKPLTNPDVPEWSPMLDFIERHATLKCLGWPMDRFFAHDHQSREVMKRVREVTTSLSQTLEDLRVDYFLSMQGEPLTDSSWTPDDTHSRVRRRKFIQDFAAEMRAVKSIKMEGGIPRDEKRETVRALGHCPLEKLVFIGASFPLVNAWGVNGEELEKIHPNTVSDDLFLEAEDDDAALRAFLLGSFEFTKSYDDTDSEQDYVPRYGWTSEPSGTSTYPLLHQIATHHRKTIRELKFCGYIAAPILALEDGDLDAAQASRTSTKHALASLKYFHELRQIVISFWPVTWFYGARRDSDIIAYWLKLRSSSRSSSTTTTTTTTLDATSATLPPEQPESTPATPNTGPDDASETSALDSDPAFELWLESRFHPRNLARHVARFFEHRLSRRAMARPTGVRVRASFCLGDDAQDIFDFDTRIGLPPLSATDVAEVEVLGWNWPKEDSWDEGRSAEKMGERRWF